MRRATLLAFCGAAAASLSAAPAQAQVFHDDDGGWCLWCFHSYGGDVNRPGRSPDRPYWHGDDAVPRGMRWQDLDAARAEAAAEDAAAAAAAAAELSAAASRRRHVARRAPRVRVLVPDHGTVLVRKD